MELRHIKYFSVLAEELNYSRAAERLCITQPPLTRQIQQLEDELGTPLFVRNSKKVELTVAGQLFREEARTILNMVSQFKERTKQLTEGKIGQLDVGIFGSAILNDIPQLLLSFRQRHPLVNITIHQQGKDEQLQALREKRITVGFNRLVPPEAGIAIEAMFDEPLLVAVHESDSLAGQPLITLNDLIGKPLIIYPNATRNSFAQNVVALFDEAHIAPSIVQDAPDVLTSIALVSSGLGLCITPQSAERLQLPNVIYRPLWAQPMPTIGMSCLYRDDDDSPILKSFLEIVREYTQAKNRHRHTD